MIDADVKLGRNVTIFNKDLVNLFGCEIGDDSFVGPFVEITRGVTIGKACIIESHSFLCTGVVLRDNVFVGHGVMFVNDLFPMRGKKVQYLETLVKRNASLGTNSTIVGGITIGQTAVIGAGSVVTKDVADFAIVAGNPARLVKQFDSEDALLAYMIRRQPLRS
jgi:UDP-2-acetamido-3-amino-2,3-dideoxy-glucuronate N-acetyltransferase